MVYINYIFPVYYSNGFNPKNNTLKNDVFKNARVCFVRSFKAPVYLDVVTIKHNLGYEAL